MSAATLSQWFLNICLCNVFRYNYEAIKLDRPHDALFCKEAQATSVMGSSIFVHVMFLCLIMRENRGTRTSNMLTYNSEYINLFLVKQHNKLETRYEACIRRAIAYV